MIFINVIVQSEDKKTPAKKKAKAGAKGGGKFKGK